MIIITTIISSHDTIQPISQHYFVGPSLRRIATLVNPLCTVTAAATAATEAAAVPAAARISSGSKQRPRVCANIVRACQVQLCAVVRIRALTNGKAFLIECCACVRSFDRSSRESLLRQRTHAATGSSSVQFACMHVCECGLEWIGCALRGGCILQPAYAPANCDEYFSYRESH